MTPLYPFFKVTPPDAAPDPRLEPGPWTLDYSGSRTAGPCSSLPFFFPRAKRHAEKTMVPTRKSAQPGISHPHPHPRRIRPMSVPIGAFKIRLLLQVARCWLLS